MDYQHIKPLDKKPEVVRETHRKTTQQMETLTEFSNAENVTYAEVNPDIVGLYKKPRTCARALGRIAKTLKLENVKVYSDSEKVYLERV
jgi:hypothetical protein